MDEFLFNLSCMEEHEKVELDGWIYYINSPDISESGDGLIWKIKPDGTENQKVQKSQTKVYAIVGIEDKWIYFVCSPDYEKGSPDDTEKKIARFILNYNVTQNRKMTLIGGLERKMTEEDEEYWENELERIEEILEQGL